MILNTVPQALMPSESSTAQNLVPVYSELSTAQNSDNWCTVKIVKTLITTKNENSKLILWWPMYSKTSFAQSYDHCTAKLP